MLSLLLAAIYFAGIHVGSPARQFLGEHFPLELLGALDSRQLSFFLCCAAHSRLPRAYSVLAIGTEPGAQWVLRGSGSHCCSSASACRRINW